MKIVVKGGIGESSYSRATNNWGTLYFTVYLDDGIEPPPDPGTGSGID